MGNRILIVILVLACSMLVVLSSSAAGTNFLAGAAKVNITPLDAQKQFHDSLYARSLILEAGGNKIAFVAVDLGGFYNAVLAKACKEKFGLKDLFFCSSHTHSGANSKDPKFLEGKIMNLNLNQNITKYNRSKKLKRKIFSDT